VVLDLILILFAGYLLLGLLFALGFVFKGVNTVDPVAADAPLIFRLMILPGSVGLWPIVLTMWARASRRNGGSAS